MNLIQPRGAYIITKFTDRYSARIHTTKQTTCNMALYNRWKKETNIRDALFKNLRTRNLPGASGKYTRHRIRVKNIMSLRSFVQVNSITILAILFLLTKCKVIAPKVSLPIAITNTNVSKMKPPPQ